MVPDDVIAGKITATAPGTGAPNRSNMCIDGDSTCGIRNRALGGLHGLRTMVCTHSLFGSSGGFRSGGSPSPQLRTQLRSCLRALLNTKLVFYPKTLKPGLRRSHQVVRYPWYAFSTIGACPGWLTWLRYTVFVPMYPFGVVSEMMLLYLALPFAKAREMYNIDMPNAFNFGFDWHKFMVVRKSSAEICFMFTQGGLVYYPFAWLQLYTHMFAQRKKKLGVSKKTE
eukprot:1186822-Prorocentrum_minimum.AAC.5